ncbi:MAG: transcriptional regulator GcvA [Pseudolabrys sp.]|jgi:LysR family transcriptional regulator, glycine cleavage system transcriptional activator
MRSALPPLSALRAFEAAARHLSFAQAARELNVTAGALSHQIRGLEDFLGVKLFERRVRAIALTTAGKQLYPGLQTGFAHIREAVASLDVAHAAHVLVVSTSPGLTSKWLARRLYRFGEAYPDIDVRISSAHANANFATDGIDLAVRNMQVDQAPDTALESEKLVDITYVPVCSPRLLEQHGPVKDAQALARLPLIHDETLAARGASPDWSRWFAAAGVDNADVRRGLRFNSADHALDAAAEGAGVLLTYDIMAYDDLRTGRLIMPVKLALPSGRAFSLVWAKGRKPTAAADAFRRWIKREADALDWRGIRE